jgi:hypothetical protein
LAIVEVNGAILARLPVDEPTPVTHDPIPRFDRTGSAPHPATWPTELLADLKVCWSYQMFWNACNEWRTG